MLFGCLIKWACLCNEYCFIPLYQLFCNLWYAVTSLILHMELKIKYITALKRNRILKGKKLYFAFLDPGYPGYELDARVLIAGWGIDFSFYHHFQTASGAHLASHWMNSGSSSLVRGQLPLSDTEVQNA